jgi:hypothetical protein
MVILWGLSVVSTIAEKDGGVTSWRRTVVTLTQMRFNGLRNWPRWGEKREKLSVQRFTFAIATKRSVAKSFGRSWVYFLARFWRFEGYEYGPRTNTRWMTSPHWLFENLDCSRKIFYFYYFHLASRNRIDATRSSRLVAWDQVDRNFHKTIMRKRKANKRVPKFSCMKITSCGNFRIILLTPLLTS